MQMYRVKFARKLSGDRVDLGDVIVCAETQESARETACRILCLPRIDTQTDVSRVKPSLYQIARRVAHHSVACFDAKTVDDLLLSTATFPGVTESMKDEYWFSVEAQANIRAIDENEAIRKLGSAISREMNGEKQKGSVKELDIKCDRVEFHARTAAVEQNSLYAVEDALRLFRGGDARPR